MSATNSDLGRNSALNSEQYASEAYVKKEKKEKRIFLDNKDQNGVN